MDPSVPDRWWEPFRQVGSVRVLYIDLRPQAAREAVASTWLDAAEQSRSRRFRSAPARRRYVLCRAALRALLCEQIGCANEHLSFGAADGGKPFALLDGRPVGVAFNVSHSGEHGLIALAPAGRVGVDVEEYAPRRNPDRLAGAVFGPNEQAELAAAGGHERIRLFFRLWTLKEAVTKALGTGLSLDASSFEIPAAVRAGDERGIVRIPDVPQIAWQLDSLCNERFAAAVAQEARKPGN